MRFFSKNSSGDKKIWLRVHCKKRFAIFPSTAGMLRTKLSLDGNTLFIPVQGELVSDIPAGDGKIFNLFLQCSRQGCIGNTYREQEDMSEEYNWQKWLMKDKKKDRSVE